ncbi:MAG TPA: SRPBCC family protein [Acidimicrobiales bacterium]|nr:SRPBCC family protein [Acidimicrobiales bacterium]
MSSQHVSIDVAAPPAVVYDLLADITRMPDWSPEVTSCAWLGGATQAEPGARFRGWSRKGWRRWSTLSTVCEADRPERFEWDVRFAGLPVATWRYRFTDDDARGTRITETVIDQRGRLLRQLSPLITGSRNRQARNEETMLVTLERLKDAAERSSSR